MKKPVNPIKKGTLVQISPFEPHSIMYAGCFMVVTESRENGCLGYIQCIGQFCEEGHQQSYMANWGEIEVVGSAKWIAHKVYKDPE